MENEYIYHFRYELNLPDVSLHLNMLYVNYMPKLFSRLVLQWNRK